MHYKKSSKIVKRDDLAVRDMTVFFERHESLYDIRHVNDIPKNVVLNKRFLPNRMIFINTGTF